MAEDSISVIALCFNFRPLRCSDFSGLLTFIILLKARLTQLTCSFELEGNLLQQIARFYSIENCCAIYYVLFYRCFSNSLTFEFYLCVSETSYWTIKDCVEISIYYIFFIFIKSNCTYYTYVLNAWNWKSKRSRTVLVIDIVRYLFLRVIFNFILTQIHKLIFEMHMYVSDERDYSLFRT